MNPLQILAGTMARVMSGDDKSTVTKLVLYCDDTGMTSPLEVELEQQGDSVSVLVFSEKDSILDIVIDQSVTNADCNRIQQSAQPLPPFDMCPVILNGDGAIVLSTLLGSMGRTSAELLTMYPSTDAFLKGDGLSVVCPVSPNPAKMVILVDDNDDICNVVMCSDISAAVQHTLLSLVGVHQNDVGPRTPVIGCGQRVLDPVPVNGN
jgi:hypothetical protein